MAQAPDFSAQFKAAVEGMKLPIARMAIALEAADALSSDAPYGVSEFEFDIAYQSDHGETLEEMREQALTDAACHIEKVRLIDAKLAEAAK